MIEEEMDEMIDKSAELQRTLQNLARVKGTISQGQRAQLNLAKEAIQGAINSLRESHDDVALESDKIN